MNRVDKSRSHGSAGPDLTRFASRQTLGSGVAPNDDDGLRSGLRDPQVLKPGCLVPNLELDDLSK